MRVTVQPAPSGHPYVPHVRLPSVGADVEVWPDPPVPGADAGQWWPPRALRPSGLREHRPGVLHVHFGLEHYSPAQLAAAMSAAGQAGTAVVVTVPHDPVAGGVPARWARHPGQDRRRRRSRGAPRGHRPRPSRDDPVALDRPR